MRFVAFSFSSQNWWLRERQFPLESNLWVANSLVSSFKAKLAAEWRGRRSQLPGWIIIMKKTAVRVLSGSKLECMKQMFVCVNTKRRAVEEVAGESVGMSKGYRISHNNNNNERTVWFLQSAVIKRFLGSKTLRKTNQTIEKLAGWLKVWGYTHRLGGATRSIWVKFK